MDLCLNMIVKNESARIERALLSVSPYISSWVIVDTGSTDDTKDKIVSFFKARNIVGEIRDEPFEDWSQARNAALNWARQLSFAYVPDYFLLMDADMELVVKDFAAFQAKLEGASYDMWQHAGSTHYQNRRLVRAGALGDYRGVTHEYLDIPSAGLIPEEVALFYDHADGANRPEKFKRDIRLLLKGLKKEPNNERYFFYLACSYRDAGMPAQAAKWFKRRVEAGGWDEEVWQAHLNLAHAYKDMGKEPEFVSTLLGAYNRRPTRAETMYDLAHYYRNKGWNAPALAAAEAVEHLPKSTDALFVNDFVYKAGIQEEIGITSFYVPGKRYKGLLATDKLSMQQSNYWSAINTARANVYHYLDPIATYCPSFKWRQINFTPPEGWVALNPSVCVHAEALHVNVRCVNYEIDAWGRYLIRNTETGEITNDNPINTQNYVLYLGADPHSDTTPWAFECYRDGNMPVEFPLVVGFEDMRIWSKKGELWGSSSVRQLHADGVPEQVLTRLAPARAVDHYGLDHVDMVRMLREPRECEKNWSPILFEHGLQWFMWRPGIVVDQMGKTVTHRTSSFHIDNMSGSSQVIPFRGGWLAVLHTAHDIPGTPGVRHYYHRFIQYAADFTPQKVSLPFYFNDKGIEFCAGLCFHPHKDELVLSYGWKDREARIATVKASDVETMLWANSRS